MARGETLLDRMAVESAYFSGRALFPRRGMAGAILRFDRVRTPRSAPFQPLRAREISPKFLDRMIVALKGWNFDIVGIDEACHRAVTRPTERRFVCLTFDGAWKDFITEAYPVLSQHAVPFTLYVPSAFPDGLGEAWWLGLERVIAQESRIGLTIAGSDRHFVVATADERRQLFELIETWLRSLPPTELSAAINDLCKRYAVDLAGLTRAAVMDWDDITRLAGDPLATIGSATVNHPVLAHLRDADALREMSMGRAVLEAALHREVRHFAFPFGEPWSWKRSQVALARQAGFASAVLSQPGIVMAEGRTPLLELPRIAWDGRRRSLRTLRVLLSGVTFPVTEPVPLALD